MGYCWSHREAISLGVVSVFSCRFSKSIEAHHNTVIHHICCFRQSAPRVVHHANSGGFPSYGLPWVSHLFPINACIYFPINIPIFSYTFLYFPLFSYIWFRYFPRNPWILNGGPARKNLTLARWGPHHAGGLRGSSEAWRLVAVAAVAGDLVEASDGGFHSHW